MKRLFVLIASLLVAAQVQAADIPPAKKALIDQVMKLWPLDFIGVKMLIDPVSEIRRQSNSLLQGRVSEEKKIAVMKQIDEEARKFLEENAPRVRADSEKLMATTVAPILNEKFNEEELKQVIALLQSPIKKKFEAIAPDLQRALGTKLAEVDKPVIQPKMDAFNQKVGELMRAAVAGQ
ncbi:DUF2059 domain-containing protein [Burkholderiaceae bacterium DAT-1]|nr:DUF2059 domain-containing protein [Burkholderiaceae bacterium DAT-1]